MTDHSGSAYFDIAMTPSVIALQTQMGSLGVHVTRPGLGPGDPHALDRREKEFLTSRDSFSLSSVSETGWPYVQHRGGEPGFVTVLDDHTIGWVERKGNRQYIGTGNIHHDGRVSAIFMDYPTRDRLKIFGRATHHREASSELLEALGAPAFRNDGAITVEVLATAWNCAKQITPRFTQDQVNEHTQGLRARIAELEDEVARLLGSPSQR